MRQFRAIGCATAFVCFTISIAIRAAAQTPPTPTASGSASSTSPDSNESIESINKESLTEVNKKLSNPISSTWSLTFQENTYWIHPGVSGASSRNQVNIQFQPVLPVALTKDWNLITRPVFQAMNSTPYLNASGNLHRVTGFGDTTLVTMLSPSSELVGNWLFAAGPTFVFPTASNSRLGQNKWQMGPAGVFGYLGEKFLIGVFPQQWWSTGGVGSNTTSQLNLQYFAVYFFGQGWGVGTSPNMLVNWNAPTSGDMLTFPIGAFISKVDRIGVVPVRFLLQGMYMPVHPDHFGQTWQLQLVVVPVIPKLIKGNVFDRL